MRPWAAGASLAAVILAVSASVAQASDPLTISQIVSLGAALQIGGPILAVLVIWWIDRRDIQKILKMNTELMIAYREDTVKAMQLFENKYDNNILLVKSWERMSMDQKDVIITNTQALTRLADTLKYNRLCPNIKVEMT